MVRRAQTVRAAPTTVLLIALASLALAVAGCDFAAQATPSPTPIPTEQPTLAPEPTPEPTASSAGVPAAPIGTTEEATVIRVVDGDTIEVEIDGQAATVRYIGMNAPELAETSASGQDEPVARQAMAANRGLVADRTVTLELDTTEIDEDGRLLRYVWVEVNGTLRLVNHILLARGFARIDVSPPDLRYVEAFAIAEAAARDRAAGVWAEDIDEPSPTPEPSATPVLVVTDGEIPIGEGQTAFRGEAGTYRWTTLTFTSINDFLIRWSATSTSGACKMEWSLTGANTASGRASRSEPGQANGRATLSAPVEGNNELTVTTDCRKWLITFNEIEPPPTPEPTPEPTAEPTAGPTEEPTAEPTESAEPSPEESAEPSP